MTTETTLLLILDAGRSDYARANVAPFLSSLASRARVGETESPPGFAQRTCMFTGTYPDTSGNFSAFGFEPESSPFAWTRRLRWLRALYKPRRIVWPARMAVKWLTRRITGAYHTDPAWIPLEFLPHFRVVEDQRPIFDAGALPFPSLFDLCRDAGKRFLYAAHPVSGDDEKTERLVVEHARRREPVDLYVAQFSALDEEGHHHGPLLPDGAFPGQRGASVERMEAALREVDARIARVVGELETAYDRVNLLVLGDHGMAPVRRRVDVLATLRATGLSAGRDYVAFVDSTYLKVWLLTPEAERRIPAALERIDWGHALTEAERRALRIGFASRRYGDILVAADLGVLFWPDYFHVTDRVIRGMHGYVDKREETYGLLLLRASEGAAAPLGRRMLVDVFPTLCDLVGLPTPATSEGRSMLEGRARAPVAA